MLLVRETPLHLGHLRLMTGVTEAGAAVLPPVPGFYVRPTSITDLVDHPITKVLDQFGLDAGLLDRWTGLQFVCYILVAKYATLRRPAMLEQWAARRQLLFGIGFVVLAVVAAACGGGGDMAGDGSSPTDHPAAAGTGRDDPAGDDPAEDAPTGDDTPEGPADGGELTGEPVRIGLVTDLTGRFVTFGNDIRAATELAVGRINAEGGINGSPIELEVQDTGGEPEQAVTAIRALAADDVFAISGPLSSGEAEVVFAQASQVGVPIMSGTANKDGITQLGDGWAFLNQATNTAIYTEAIPAWMEEYDITTAALIFDEEEPVSAAAATDAMPAVASDVGLDIINADSPITFTRGQTDFSTAVQRIRQTEADALIIMSAPAEAGLIARELSRQGETRPVMGHPSQGSQSFFQTGGAEITDWMLPLIFNQDADDPDVQEFVEAMNEVIEPPLVAESANYYDNILMFAQVMRDAGVDGSTVVDEAREAIRDGLLALTDFDGITGTLSFAGSQDATKTIHLVVVQNGEPTPL